MGDWAEYAEWRILHNAGVGHLDSLKARLGGTIAAALRKARADALEEARVAARGALINNSKFDEARHGVVAALIALRDGR